MKQLCFQSLNKMQWRELSDIKLNNDDQAIVRPTIMGRCDLDVGFVRGILPLQRGASVGHEIIGEIVEVGNNVKGFQPGDKVVVPAQISCGKCRNCIRGFTGRCLSVPFAASYGMEREGNFGGGVADLVLVPFANAMLFPLPENVNPVEWIGFADMAQDAYRAVGPPLLERPNATVLVLGGLPEVIGIYSAAIAVAMRAGKVVYYDNDPRRLAEAKKYGAEILNSDEHELSHSFEIIVDSSINETALHHALHFVVPEGVVTSVSVHMENESPLPLVDMYHKGIHYRTGRPNCRAHMEAVSKLCCGGHFHPQKISALVVDYDDALDAWTSDEMRVVLVRK